MPERSNVHLNIMYDPWLKIEWINNKKEEINDPSYIVVGKNKSRCFK